MSTNDRHAFRRKLLELEAPLFAGPATPAIATSAEVDSALMPLAKPLGHDAQYRVERLRRLYAGGSAGERTEYRTEFGACGVRRFLTADDAVIYSIPIETFHNHVNNVFVIRQHSRITMVDAGTNHPVALADFARAALVLAASFGEPSDLLDRVGDMVITHAHIDHFGAVGRWRQSGARLHIHEYDARVLTNIEERMVVTAIALRNFLRQAGVSQERANELEQMYVSGKQMFKSVPVDRVMVDQDRVAGLKVHHVPGHCPGQVCVQVDNVLLTADHVLSRITPHQSPESITQSTGLDTYLDSLEKVRKIPGITLALGAHEEPIPRLSERLIEIENFHSDRLAKVRDLCVGEPLSLVDISKRLFGDQSGYGRLLALEEAGAHVEYLSRRGHLEIANLDDLLGAPAPVLKYRASANLPLQSAHGL